MVSAKNIFCPQQSDPFSAVNVVLHHQTPMGIMWMDMNISAEDITPWHRARESEIDSFKRAHCFSLHCALLIIWILSCFFFFFFFFQSSNSSCEAYQAAAASRHAAEIVFLTVTGDVQRKLFSWEINSVHDNHNLVVRGHKLLYTEVQLWTEKSNQGCWRTNNNILWCYMFKIVVLDWCLSGPVHEISASPPLTSHPDT